MILVTRRRVLVAVLALFLLGVGTIVWTLSGLPPIKYYLRYGLDPYCETTGERETHEGVEFVEVGPGIFRMGSTYLAEGGGWLGRICAPLGLPWGKHPKPSNEMPVHWVEFRKGFWIATTEVTNAQYTLFKLQSQLLLVSKGDDRPIANVSWQEAKDYCAWIAARSGRAIRLPSEAEWECACRAGGDGEFGLGAMAGMFSDHAWYAANSGNEVHAVATKRPNQWGLHDLSGNVLEWCEDTWHDSYDGVPTDGSPWVFAAAPYRVVRGGAFNTAFGRSASRVRGAVIGPSRYGEANLGFRPAFSNPE